ncbi:MAG: 50S ribosome-binding GTPase, partial [Cyanobacteria bacterium]|nr:50S ribosome-binding GTPase [Cyanobacteriota bacterium]MDW8203222.1 GTPase [Cyanobacteriota bacterium SKYGB_h_bin112]
RVTITDPVTHYSQSLVLTDTVGFIHDLPPALMDAFRATLEEVTEADALLHVVDLSHPAWQTHLQVVDSLLAEMPTLSSSTLLVFNKLDQADSDALSEAMEQYPQAVYVSARDRLGLETLRQRLMWLVQVAITA